MIRLVTRLTRPKEGGVSIGNTNVGPKTFLCRNDKVTERF